MATVSVQLRINPNVKKLATELFSELGLTLSGAINLFLYQCVLRGEIPFDIKSPGYNQRVLDAMVEAKIIAKDDSWPSYDNMEDLLKSLKSDDD